jgi:mevalonate kinase
MNYPAKIILFGEYGVLLGAKALAMPYLKFSGQIILKSALDSNNDELSNSSHASLNKLYQYFRSNVTDFQYLNLDLFESELSQGVLFQSTIPNGSGLGSSGAVSAAIYGRYLFEGSETADLMVIKQRLSAIESCFHQVSSGIDPLISWINKPILIDTPNAIVREIDLSTFFKTYTLFLINSNKQGETGLLVANFMSKLNQSDFKEQIENNYITIINQTIESLLANDFSTFETSMTEYSSFQRDQLNWLIADQYLEHFEYGISSGDFQLKICGSGGGGFLLGIAKNRILAENYFKSNCLDYTIVY